MFKKIFINYLKNITINDIKKFGMENNILVNDDEAKIILKYIKNDYEILMYKDSSSIFKNLESEIDINKSKKIEELFLYYKNKYKFYL